MKLLSISYEGVAHIRGPRHGRHTPTFEVPAATVIHFFDPSDGLPKRLAYRGDLSRQSALDAARRDLPGLDAAEFISAFNATAASPAWHLV